MHQYLRARSSQYQSGVFLPTFMLLRGSTFSPPCIRKKQVILNRPLVTLSKACNGWLWHREIGCSIREAASGRCEAGVREETANGVGEHAGQHLARIQRYQGITCKDSRDSHLNPFCLHLCIVKITPRQSFLLNVSLLSNIYCSRQGCAGKNLLSK